MPTDCEAGDLRPECFPGGQQPYPGDVPAGGTQIPQPPPCPDGMRDPVTNLCTGSSPAGGAAACEGAGNVWDYQNNVCMPIDKTAGQPRDKKGDEYSGYQLPAFNGGFKLNTGAPPGFNAPQFSYPDFDAPNPEDIYKDPSYQWRLDQGRKSLEKSAAARGTLRSGGTLQGILEHGQQFGAQEFGSLFDRSLQTYTTNRGTALDVFDRLYQGAKDEYAPKLLGWQTGVENERISAMRAWEDYWRRIDDQWRRENAVFQAGIPN